MALRLAAELWPTLCELRNDDQLLGVVQREEKLLVGSMGTCGRRFRLLFGGGEIFDCLTATSSRRRPPRWRISGALLGGRSATAPLSSKSWLCSPRRSA